VASVALAGLLQSIVYGREDPCVTGGLCFVLVLFLALVRKELQQSCRDRQLISFLIIRATLQAAEILRLLALNPGVHNLKLGWLISDRLRAALVYVRRAVHRQPHLSGSSYPQEASWPSRWSRGELTAGPGESHRTSAGGWRLRQPPRCRCSRWASTPTAPAFANGYIQQIPGAAFRPEPGAFAAQRAGAYPGDASLQPRLTSSWFFVPVVIGIVLHP